MVDAGGQRALQRGAVFDLAAAHLGQLRNILLPTRLVDVQSLVRAERRRHHSGNGRIFLDFLMPFQRIHRVVCGTDKGHVALGDQPAHAHARLLQLFVAQIPDLFGCFSIQSALITEVLFQLQMAPMVHGVSDGTRQSLGKFLEFLPVRRIARNVLFLHAVGAHHTPFVMVAAQPHLGDVLKPAVLEDLPRADVAVIVDDGHIRRIFMIELLRRGSGKQKILVHKGFHWDRSSCSFYSGRRILHTGTPQNTGPFICCLKFTIRICNRNCYYCFLHCNACAPRKETTPRLRTNRPEGCCFSRPQSMGGKITVYALRTTRRSPA